MGIWSDIDAKREAKKAQSLARQRRRKEVRRLEKEREERKEMELRFAGSIREQRDIKARYAEMPEIEPPVVTYNETGAESVSTGYGYDPITDSAIPEGSGIPDGYVETSVILCQDGSPVNGSILFKED